MEEHLTPSKMPLLANPTFYSCIINTKESGPQYIVMKNTQPVHVSEETIDKSAAFEAVIRSIEEVEKYLLFILNFPVFFPAIWAKTVAEQGKPSENYLWLRNNIPIQSHGGKWTSHLTYLDLNKRLNFVLRKDNLDAFLGRKNFVRFKHAYEYFIRSFCETTHESSFCTLISAIDAITGSRSKSSLTKSRLAKYSSVLLCEPLRIVENEKNLQLLYKLRSDYVHGKGSKIRLEDEFILREYVRAFLIAYFLFVQELKAVNEPQMLQTLDQIYDDHSVYIKRAPAAYMFISSMRKHESGYEKMFDTALEEQKRIAQRILMEPMVSEFTKHKL